MIHNIPPVYSELKAFIIDERKKNAAEYGFGPEYSKLLTV